MSTEAAFAAELEAILPPDLPSRDRAVSLGARHLSLVTDINEQMNLTRITSPREAAVKHILDSVLPWTHLAEARNILDLGSGAGFPGIPLALVFPDKRFVLVESIGKKARFLEQAVEHLGLANVDVEAARAEDLLRTVNIDCVVVRAVTAVGKLMRLLEPVLHRTPTLLLYKGPDIETELREAGPELRHVHMHAEVAMRYELPYGYGTRSLVLLTHAAVPEKRPRQPKPPSQKRQAAERGYRS